MCCHIRLGDAETDKTGPTWIFPGGPVAKTLHSQCKGPGFDSGWGTRSHMLKIKILHAITNTW